MVNEHRVLPVSGDAVADWLESTSAAKQNAVERVFIVKDNVEVEV